jgi:hypothetical protein
LHCRHKSSAIVRAWQRNSTISFTIESQKEQRGFVRCSPVLFLICLYPAAGWTQAQQASLVDRLLRPNLNLQNSAQGKTFPAGSYAATRSSATREFVLEALRKQKSFSETRALAAWEYRAHSFQSISQSGVVPRNLVANLLGRMETQPAPLNRQTYDAHLAIAGRKFANERQLREQGKSQQSLNRQNPALTIGQVRELLNKNK